MLFPVIAGLLTREPEAKMVPAAKGGLDPHDPCQESEGKENDVEDQCTGPGCVDARDDEEDKDW